MTDLDLIGVAIHEAYGPPCDDFDPECAGCKTWAAFGRMQWQPIETAPKDGTRIVAIRNEWRHSLPSFVHWDDEDGWCGMTANDEKIIAIHEPTHWIPLPEPPEQTGAES